MSETTAPPAVAVAALGAAERHRLRAAPAAVVLVLAAAAVGWGWWSVQPGVSASSTGAAPSSNEVVREEPAQAQIAPAAASDVAVPRRPPARRADAPPAQVTTEAIARAVEPDAARVDSDALEIREPKAIEAQLDAPRPDVAEAPRLPVEAFGAASAAIVEQALMPRPAPALSLPVSEGATSPKLLMQTLPRYPENIRRRGVAGDVVLTVQITDTGSVGNVSILRGNAALARAAVEAVRQWRFEPGTLNGKAVAVETTVTFRFKP